MLATATEYLDFLNSYLECSAWADCPEENIQDGLDFDLESKDRAHNDCVKFLETKSVCEMIGENISQAGHDFWLSRNGHGSGFWDREEIWGNNAQKLHEIAKGFGELHVYVQNENLSFEG